MDSSNEMNQESKIILDCADDQEFDKRIRTKCFSLKSVFKRVTFSTKTLMEEMIPLVAEKLSFQYRNITKKIALLEPLDYQESDGKMRAIFIQTSTPPQTECFRLRFLWEKSNLLCLRNASFNLEINPY